MFEQFHNNNPIPKNPILLLFKLNFFILLFMNSPWAADIPHFARPGLAEGNNNPRATDSRRFARPGLAKGKNSPLCGLTSQSED
jgi:hypothetical protein